jgi:hypothetical protein
MTEHASLKFARAPSEQDEINRQDESAQHDSTQHQTAQCEPAQQEVDSRIPKTVLVQRRFAGRSPARESSPRQPVKREAPASESAKREPAKRRLNPSDLSRLDLARLEALLANELKRSPSPSIAADDADEMPPAVRAPARRPAPSAQLSWLRAAQRSEPPLAARREPPELRLPADPEPELQPQPEPEPETARLRAAVMHRLDEGGDLPPLAREPHGELGSRVGRTMRTAATVFSLMALVAISALLVLLVVSGDPSEPVAAERASDTPPPMEQDVSGPHVVTASASMPRDESRIPQEEHSVRPAGTVRAADVQDTPSAESPLAANATNAPSPAALDTQSVFAPPVAEQYASAGQGFSSMNAGAAPAEESAPLETAALETSPAAAGQAAETRSAPVTAHVNMRAGPDNDATVVVVVPEGRNVDVVECTQWCEVVYDGRQGFIHKRFVTGAGG